MVPDMCVRPTLLGGACVYNALTVQWKHCNFNPKSLHSITHRCYEADGAIGLCRGKVNALKGPELVK